jgi:hypothetical protein
MPALSYTGGAILREKAVYCDNCDTISEAVSNGGRCGQCGSESIFALAGVIGEPSSAVTPGKLPVQTDTPKPAGVFAYRAA